MCGKRPQSDAMLSTEKCLRKWNPQWKGPPTAAQSSALETGKKGQKAKKAREWRPYGGQMVDHWQGSNKGLRTVPSSAREI